MRANRLSSEYKQGVIEFLEFAESNIEKDLPPPKSNAEKRPPVLILCPCVHCGNQEPKRNRKEIMTHLIGFIPKRGDNLTRTTVDTM
ncbi:hypothetical protein QL285_075866 [Trifolium repens]|nr:hypothetical protein QL285_075866 [Trifolium repens]